MPPQRLLEVLLEEHHEDLARLGGYLHSTDAARIRRVVAREALTGVLVGILLGAGAFVVIAFAWRDLPVAATVGLAVLVAMALPWLLSRLGRDPAFGSGPLATVVQDLLSILIYFTTAAVLLS